MTYKRAEWEIRERPGYLGKTKDAKVSEWNVKWNGNWRLAWEVDGELLEFAEVFREVYVTGYKKRFRENPMDAKLIADLHSYTYDKDLIPRDEAFDPSALYDKPGRPNQFHHVALNIALEALGYEFKGDNPLQVREGKPNTPVDTWPEGWRFSPGRIMATQKPNENVTFENEWWKKGSVEHVYQSTKVVIVKKKNG